ncbi:MAG: helix-turn-helix domain-containing protein [archaeon]
MFEEILEDIGLSKSEIKVLQVLLKNGRLTISCIIKDSKVSTGKIYFILNKLASKGLIAESRNNGKRHFSATDPEKILDILLENKKKILEEEIYLKKILPELKSNYKKELETSFADVYEGAKGFKTIFGTLLRESKKGDIFRAYGVSTAGNDKVKAYLQEWHKERIKKEVFAKIIYNYDARQYARNREKMKLTTVKFIDSKDIVTPTSTIIFKDYIILENIANNNPKCFLIKDKDTAESYIKYFEVLWKNASK